MCLYNIVTIPKNTREYFVNTTANYKRLLFFGNSLAIFLIEGIIIRVGDHPISAKPFFLNILFSVNLF